MDGWMDPKISFRVYCPPLSFSRDWRTSLVELDSNQDTFHPCELVAYFFEWATIESTLFKGDNFLSECGNEWHDSTLRIINYHKFFSFWESILFAKSTHPLTHPPARPPAINTLHPLVYKRIIFSSPFGGLAIWKWVFLQQIWSGLVTMSPL